MRLGEIAIFNDLKKNVMSYRLLSLLLLLCFSSFGQQKKLNGCTIYMLGNDTTMAGSYSLTGNDFEVTVLSRPNVTVTKMKGSFFPNGELKTAEGRNLFNAGFDARNYYPIYRNVIWALRADGDFSWGNQKVVY